MEQPKTRSDNRMRLRMLAYLSIALMFAWSTWFSATAVIPQLRDIWALSPSAAAWLTIAVQLGFVIGAVISSIFNIADIVASRYIIMAGAIGAAAANSLLLVADGTVQLAAGFTMTVVTIWLLPIIQGIFSWRWAFSLLAIGPIIGIWAMLRLKSSPVSAKIGGGKG